MERREDLHRHGCSIAKQTILTTHPSGLQTRVSVELANFDALCVHSECSTKPKRPMWEGSPFLSRRGILGGVSAHGTPVLGRRSDAVNEGRLSQQCTPVMRRREVESPGGSPLPMRRCEEESETDVDNSVISGWLKFRDNKRMNVTMDYQYYIIKITKELPHPSFPRIICVPKSWIKVSFPDGKVAVVLPKEDYSDTANRIRSEEPGEWAMYWAHIQDRNNDFEIAINNARVLNEVLLHEAQQMQGTEMASDNNQHQFKENQPRSIQEEENLKKIEKQNETGPIQTTNENAQNMKKSVKSQDEVSDNNLEENEQSKSEEEENQSQDEEELIEIQQENGNEQEKNIVENESQDEQDSEENQSKYETNAEEFETNSIEQDDISEFSDESWKPRKIDTENCTSDISSSYSEETLTSELEDSSEETLQGQDKKKQKQNKKNDKNLRRRKRKLEKVDHMVKNKNRKLMNTLQTENVPSTSKSEFSKIHKPSFEYQQKFMKILALNYKDLEEHFIRLDDVLEIFGTILNKITESFVEAIYNVKLMINDENLNNNSSIKHNAGQNSVQQISKKRRTNSLDDNGQPEQKSDDKGNENTPSNCDDGHYSKSQRSIQPFGDNTDKSSKWTLRYEEFKPQPGLVELLPDGGIYVSDIGLQKCITYPENTPHKLARHLLREIFSDEALRKCTLAGKSSKPGLDDYARRQLMTYVEQFCSKKGLVIDEEFERSVTSALRRKLWEYSQEI